MTKIQYKPLEKPLNMHLRIEISEKTALKNERSLKVFDISIVPAKVSFWKGTQTIEVIRKPDTNQLPNNDADTFAQQVSSILNQLNLKLDFKGMPIDVEKRQQLWQNWLDVRTNLANSYSGEWIEKTLTEIDNKLLPTENLILHIMQDVFINQYFRDVYSVTFTDNNFYRKRTAYGLCPSPILFNEKWSLDDLPKSQLIKFSAYCDEIPDEPSFNNWLKSKTSDVISEISMEGFYQLDKDTGWCSALESHYQLNTNSYKKTLKIELTTN